MKITALAPWFGSNRMLGAEVGKALAGCSWVGIPFAGSMAEVAHIQARVVHVNDLHRHIINLARVVANDELRPLLVRRLRRLLFHPDELAFSQEICGSWQPGDPPDLDLAEQYFVCCWMGRSSNPGTPSELHGSPAVRWTASGGDSVVRYRNAIGSLAAWSRVFGRCSFSTMDAFDFLARCEDREGHGVYADPPFPGQGRVYRHNAGKTEDEERDWHTRLRDALDRFQAARVVCRFYDHPLVRELYPEPFWRWQRLAGRTQANAASPEVLLLKGGPL